MISEAVAALSKKYHLPERAKVLSVDRVANTCSVQTIADDVVHEKVALQPIFDVQDTSLLGFVPYPAIGSIVIMAFADNDPVDAFVLRFSALQGVAFNFGNGFAFDFSNTAKPNLNANLFTFNGGSNGGMPLLLPLLQALNELQSNFNQLRTAFMAHVHTGVTIGPGSSGPTPTPAPKPVKLTKKNDLENSKVKQ